MLDAILIEILVCPESQQAVQEAEFNLIAELNQQIQKQSLKNRAGHLVTEEIDSGLIRDDGLWLYPVRNQIPIMLTEEALPLPQK